APGKLACRLESPRHHCQTRNDGHVLSGRHYPRTFEVAYAGCTENHGPFGSEQSFVLQNDYRVRVTDRGPYHSVRLVGRRGSDDPQSWHIQEPAFTGLRMLGTEP